MKRYRVRTALLFFVVIFLWGGEIRTVHAEGATAYFGTNEGYTWEVGTRSDIGLYLESTEGKNIDSVYMLVTYDPKALEFNSADDVGVTVLSEGQFVLKREGNWNRVFKQILHFTPLVSTHTTIEITAASGSISPVSAASDNVPAGENGIAPNNAPVGEISADVAVRAEVEVPLKPGCRLEGIYIDGEKIEGFDSGKLFYEIAVTDETDTLPITVMAENDETKTEISDNALTVGENMVYITVINSEGQRALYTLSVIKEAEPMTGALGESGTSGSEQKGEKDDYEAHSGNRDLEAADKPVREESSAGDDAERDDELSDTLNNSELAVKKAMDKRRLADFLLKGMIVLICILSVSEAVLLIVRFRRGRLKRQKSFSVTPLKKKVRRQELFGRPPVVVQALHVCMDFDRAVNEYTSIKELVIQTIKGQRIKEKYRALDDISFDIRKGSIVGVIGTNGAGKSTLLKIISGALTPTSGVMRVNRNKVQILTLGTGFDMELTGKENVYLNGAIIGYDKEFIDEHYEEIVEFAELEDFMNEKVKNYSSGMVSRLGFAIATVGPPPEILILDEVLSVGDQLFRKKSLKRIKELIHGGSTVLMVSHSTSTIRENCDKAIWLEKGHMITMGEVQDVCDMYDKYDGNLEKILAEKAKEMDEDVLEWIG